MHKQMLVSMKTIAKINKLLAEGWSFSHTVGPKQEYAILTKYQNCRELMLTQERGF